MIDERRRLAALARFDEVPAATLADLTGLCEITALACDVPNVAVHLIDDRLQRRIAAVGVEPSICLRDESMCAVAIAGAEDVHVADASADPRFRHNPWVDGRLGSVRLYASAILWTADRQPIGTLCVFDEVARDLPARRLAALHVLARQVVEALELHLLARRLQASLDDAARAQEQLAAFAGQVSHDLKTPLTTTRGFAELLADQPGVQQDPDSVRFATYCVDATDRMIEMVDGLLAYSRIGATLRVRRVPVEEVVPAVVADLGALVGDARVTWSGPDLHADPVQVRALVQNLVANALKYRRPDVPCVVGVTACVVDGRSRLEVADNGPGIPADQRETALEPLRRLRTDIPGTGLGLATCVRIARGHGGAVTITETPGGGTTVVVDLAEVS